jgi:prepilin-type N-terminal cleavage/methylation domain-containing protein
MHPSIAKKLAKKMKRQAGFTLLEILVVLTIMGFLIAMVAPRLAGISGGAVDTVCDSNQNRMISMMSGYYEKTNRYPDKLTNIVEETSTHTYQIPAISDDDPENGAETLASEFNDRNSFRIHYLNADEVAELKNMGIVNVFNLNAYDAYTEDGGAIKDGYNNAEINDVALAASVTKAPIMEGVVVNATMAVMMVGAGIDFNGDWVLETEERGWGEADFMARIVFGFGPENGLVTSGIVSNAAHCPGGIQNADNVTYNDYNIVLPRLEATVERYGTDFDAMDASADTGIQLDAVAYGDDVPADNYDYDGNTANFKVRTYELSAQETYQYATMCPEGHKFPADDEEFWGLDLNDNNQINN